MPCLVVHHGFSAQVTKGRGDAVMIEKSPVHLSANHLQMPGGRGARGRRDVKRKAERGWFRADFMGFHGYNLPRYGGLMGFYGGLMGFYGGLMGFLWILWWFFMGSNGI